MAAANTGPVSRRDALAWGGALTIATAGATMVGYRQISAMGDYDAAVAAMRRNLANNPSLQELVRFATLAPNGHNTQPWRFRVDNSQITILPDFTRRTPVVDPDDHHLFVGLGAAAENLALAAAARGHTGAVAFDPTGSGSVIVALGAGPAVNSPLFAAIRHRQSTRAEFAGRPVDISMLKQLAVAADIPGVDMAIITDRSKMAKITELVLSGNSAQMADLAFVTELKRWLRFNPHDALATADGLFSAASGSPIAPTWLGPFMFDRFLSPAIENKRYARQLNSSAGLVVFVGERADPRHWVQGGRACQRFGLQATALGLKHAFMNQPIEIARLRPDLAALIGMAGRRPDIVMRFGYGPSLPFSARRKPLIVTENGLGRLEG